MERFHFHGLKVIEKGQLAFKGHGKSQNRKIVETKLSHDLVRSSCKLRP